MNIINQDNIINIIDKYTINSLPKALLFIGEEGSGKHSIVNYLSNKLNINVIDFTKDISFENICDVFINPITNFYLINMDEISIKEQNSILKFIEEPAPSCYIILLASKESIILETINNRCVKYILNPYKKSDLIQFLADKNNLDILDVATTPGQVISLEKTDYKKTKEFAIKMVDNLAKVNISNALSITKAVSKTAEKDCYDINILSKFIKNILLNKVIETNDKKYDEALVLTLNFIKDLNANLDYRYLIDLYLIQLRDILRKS